MMVDRQALLASLPAGLYINGEWRASSDGATLDVDNPATGEVLATVASTSPVAGLSTSSVAPSDDARHSPLM